MIRYATIDPNGTLRHYAVMPESLKNGEFVFPFKVPDGINPAGLYVLLLAMEALDVLRKIDPLTP